MSINFNAYGIKSSDMNIRDLQVGQKLIRVNRNRVRIDNLEPITTATYTIVKVLKTRLVVEGEPNINGVKQTLRLLVDQASWKSADRRGEVQTDIEGNSQSYNRTAYEFATEDEQPLIDQIIATRAAQIEAREIKNHAAATVREIAGNMHPDLESVEAAILALQALADQLRAAK